MELSRYVHLNPVRAAIVDGPEQYKWSSYPGYIGKEKEYHWVEYSWILSKFGSNTERARGKYREYVQEGVREEIDTPLKNPHGQIILGEDEFIEKIKGVLKEKELSHEIIERKRLMGQVLPDEVIKKIAKSLGLGKK